MEKGEMHGMCLPFSCSENIMEGKMWKLVRIWFWV